VYAVNGHADIPAAGLLLKINIHYPDFQVDAVAGDAGFGFEAYLHTVYAALQARRVIDHRCHETDRDKTQWPTRGYDDHGQPACAYGYSLTSYTGQEVYYELEVGDFGRASFYIVETRFFNNWCNSFNVI
jgi:hypothetical protein